MEQFKQIALTWFRAAAASAIALFLAGEQDLKTLAMAAVASVLALWLAGVNDPKALAMAGVSAVAGPVLKWLDPKSTEFGRGSK